MAHRKRHLYFLEKGNLHSSADADMFWTTERKFITSLASNRDTWIIFFGVVLICHYYYFCDRNLQECSSVSRDRVPEVRGDVCSCIFLFPAQEKRRGKETERIHRKGK